MMISNL